MFTLDRGGHTHLYTENFLNYLAKKYNLVGEWWLELIFQIYTEA